MLIDEINKDYQYCFKRVYMKRKYVNGVWPNYYEPNWQDITDWLLEASDITWNVDDVEVNDFTQGDFTLTMVNRLQEFAPETYSGSKFSGFLSRHKTKVKITAGYIDSVTGVEYPYDIGAGLVDGTEINAESDSTITIPCVSPTMMFEEQSAEDVNDGILGGGNATATVADQLIDTAATFDKYYNGLEVHNVTTGEKTKVTGYVNGTTLRVQNNIFTAGDTYNFGQTRWYRGKTIFELVVYIYSLTKRGGSVFGGILEGTQTAPGNNITVDIADFTGMTCKDALDKLAEISNSVWFVDPSFFLRFLSRAPIGASVFEFTNQGLNVNILGASEYNDGIKKVINRVEWKDSEPKIAIEEASWAPGDSSSSWKNGVQIYEIDNPFVTDNTLKTAIARDILGEFVLNKEEITLHTKFIPHLKLLDPLTVTYTGVPAKSPAYFWNVGLCNPGWWNKGYWTGRLGGITIQDAGMKVIKINYNVMNFTCDFKMRRV